MEAHRHHPAVFVEDLLHAVAGLEGAIVPFASPWAKAVYHLYVIRVEDRDDLMTKLAAENIGTGIHYPIPLHLQKAYEYLGYKEGDFPVSERFAKEIVSLPMFPQASHDFAPLIFALSVIAIVYTSLVALVQEDMKKLIAYSSVSHLGFVMLGVFALNMAGLQGGILQMINHGISTGALFLLVGMAYERRHTRMISEYGGLARQMPIYATFFLVMALSSMGLPLLNGFIGEFAILQGAFAVSFWWAFFAATGIVLGAAYLLWLYQRVFFGEITNPANAGLADLTGREQLTLVPLVVLALWIGIYPKPMFEVLRLPAEKIVAAVGGKTMSAPALARNPAPAAAGGSLRGASAP